ncbi:DUF4097 family beta strand repeat-containing protein [Mucilaginibacter sp. dw_454]|uniref:DUF4097 family beta strand repeat-containing protein n=1 Tax=Mucilaginibacter sp. dw_454 TaxID=2720079 RepID=UPI001BD416CB|nr:DUF4097 family beta strand repeat-containing protein [Mucilaginibacter sp. dw_454]
MKKVKYIALIAACLLLSARIIMAQTNKEQLVVPLSDPGKPYQINVSLVLGSIKVVGYDGRDILINAESTATDDNAVKGGMHRITPARVDVTAHEKDNVVDVTTGRPQSQISLIIKIPANATSIKLSTVNGGTVEASNINGKIEVSDTNGSIKLINVGGSVVANTVNGDVDVTLRYADPKAAMAFTTLNGHIDVTFPASFKANAKLRSDRGELYSDFNMVTEKSVAKTTRDAKNGSYRIAIEDWVTGKINGGGPELLMKSFLGNIFLRKGK